MPTFQLQIVTPQRVMYQGEVESFWAPGLEGSFQVLAGHIPLMTVLQVGEISFHKANSQRQYAATSGGFVEVLRTGVMVVVETAEFAGEIDINRAEAARNRARERLRKRESGTDIDRANAALARALNRLHVAGRE